MPFPAFTLWSFLLTHCSCHVHRLNHSWETTTCDDGVYRWSNITPRVFITRRVYDLWQRCCPFSCEAGEDGVWKWMLDWHGYWGFPLALSDWQSDIYALPVDNGQSIRTYFGYPKSFTFLCLFISFWTTTKPINVNYYRTASFQTNTSEIHWTFRCNSM